jgi:D-alanyl-lipoteichoic acid acyltransferase DltB (MBOAT superfamily)
MLFNSLEFLFFIPILILLTLVKNKSLYKLLILFVSLFFYFAFQRQYLIYFAIFILISYFISIISGKLLNSKYKNYYYYGIISFLIIFLIISNYLPFLNGVISIVNGTNYNIPISFPSILGISYIVFQLISYYTEIFRGNLAAEKNFINFAIYISYFPKLVSGPIERGNNFLPQLSSAKQFNSEIYSGLKLIVWGLFAKVVISDRLSPIVNNVFSNSGSYNSFQVLLAVLFFSFQLYFDFMGYSYMAVGVSKILGINLSNNFLIPFFSKSITEFWKRWHISFSSWLRDYIFLPIAYKVVRKASTIKITKSYSEKLSYLSGTFFTMLICGIWHGPKMTFIIWGLIHAIFMIVSFLTKSRRKKLIKKIGI